MASKAKAYPISTKFAKDLATLASDTTKTRPLTLATVFVVAEEYIGEVEHGGDMEASAMELDAAVLLDFLTYLVNME